MTILHGVYIMVDENFYMKLKHKDQYPGITLDCTACKTPAAMTAQTVSRFETFLRIIGYIIVIPSVIGVGFALLLVLSTTLFGSASAIAATVGYGLSIFIAAVSLVCGLGGWLLLSTKKVYRCYNCGFVLDRA